MRRWTLPALLLLGTGVCGFAAVHAAPVSGHLVGIWPVGAAAAAVVLAPAPGRWWLVPVVFLEAWLSITWGGRPPGVAVGYAAAVALETCWVAALLGRPEGGPFRLDDDATMRRWLAAAGGGGLIGAVCGGLTSITLAWGDPGLVALGLGSAHLGSLLVLLPFAARLPGHDPLARHGEGWLQRVLLVVVAVAALGVPALPIVYVVTPLLAWAALRMTPREALVQMALVLAVAIVVTTADRGQFAGVVDALDLPVDTRGVLLALFAVTCALIVVPLTVRVAEQVEISRAATTERDRFARVFLAARGVAIIGSDVRGRVNLFNPGAERLLGYAREEVMGRATVMLHTPQAVTDKAAELGVADDFTAVARRLMEPDQAGAHIRFLRADGEERTHSMTLARLTDDRGHVVGYVSTSEDITERVATEQALSTALERMREVDTVKDTFVSSVSHELRTPLTSILGYLELLGEGAYGPLTPAQEQALARVTSNSTRLLTLVDDLLVLSRVEGGADGLGLHHAPLDLVDVVRAGVAVAVPEGRVGPQVRVVLPTERLTMSGDRDLLERAVVNLVGNAVKFTPAGGRVEVALAREPAPGDDASGTSYGVLSVRDSGIGISSADQQRLFTRFFRATSAMTAAIPGTGLGLSITHAVVERHGGSIAVESAPGEGATFRMRLPLS